MASTEIPLHQCYLHLPLWAKISQNARAKHIPKVILLTPTCAAELVFQRIKVLQMIILGGKCDTEYNGYVGRWTLR